MSDLFERILLLKQSPVFSSVDTEDLRAVAKLLEDVVLLKGERLFEIQQPSDKVYFIAEGEIGVSLHPDPKVKQFVAVLRRTDCVGEMGMFDDGPRSATAHVLQDARLLALDKSKFRALIIRYPELALGLLRTLTARLRAANLDAVKQ